MVGQWRRPSKAKDDATGKIGALVVKTVDSAVTSRWSAATKRAESLSGADGENTELVERVSRSFAREIGVIGAAAGAAAAAPGVGTGAAVVLTAGEIPVVIARTTDLILTIGVLHGHDDATIEERRAWVLSVLAFGDGASAGFTKIAGEVGKGLGAKTAKAIPMKTIRSINQALGRTIITKYGTKRGAIALGRVLPLGIGMIIGGTANYVITRGVAKHANKFFAELPTELRSVAPLRGTLLSGSKSGRATDVARTHEIDDREVDAHEADSDGIGAERQRLSDRLVSEVLDPEGAFVCAHQAECEESAAERSFGFAGGQMSFVGEHYGVTKPRVLVVSMQVGDAEAPISVDRRAEQIESRRNETPGQRNPHMRGVVRALQILHGLEVTSETERLSDGSHVLDVYAMANSTLCSALPTDGKSRRGKPTKTMLKNCERHLLATIEVLEPDVILTQGVDPRRVIEGLAEERESISETVSRVSLGGARLLVCSLSHPAAGPPLSWSSIKPGSYFDETVRPSLELTRRTVLGD